jgi:hypothetical protein
VVRCFFTLPGGLRGGDAGNIRERPHCVPSAAQRSAHRARAATSPACLQSQPRAQSGFSSARCTLSYCPPARKRASISRAWRGRSLGTMCPAPFTVRKVKSATTTTTTTTTTLTVRKAKSARDGSSRVSWLSAAVARASCVLRQQQPPQRAASERRASGERAASARFGPLVTCSSPGCQSGMSHSSRRSDHRSLATASTARWR